MEVKRVGDISQEEFMKEFYLKGIPVVFESASTVWKAKDLFTPHWFRENVGNRSTDVKGTTYTMREIMDMAETLFIPFGTWHTAYSLTPTISVAFDQLNRKNYKDFLKDVWEFRKKESKVKALATYSYARLAGQSCRITEG